jgi:hypothetical protein
LKWAKANWKSKYGLRDHAVGKKKNQGRIREIGRNRDHRVVSRLHLVIEVIPRCPNIT